MKKPDEFTINEGKRYAIVLILMILGVVVFAIMFFTTVKNTSKELDIWAIAGLIFCGTTTVTIIWFFIKLLKDFRIIKVSEKRITSETLWHKRLATIDLSKTVYYAFIHYYNYAAFEYYLLISNDIISPDSSVKYHIDDRKQINIPYTKQVRGMFPKDHWEEVELEIVNDSKDNQKYL